MKKILTSPLVYRGCIEDGDLFKSIIVTSEMKTNEVLMMILEKYEIDPLQNVDGTYVLVEEEVGGISRKLFILFYFICIFFFSQIKLKTKTKKLNLVQKDIVEFLNH